MLAACAGGSLVLVVLFSEGSGRAFLGTSHEMHNYLEAVIL